MIDKLSYEDIEKISKDLREQAHIISELLKGRDNQELNDFVATVEGYSMFLENTIEINKDADKALAELKSNIK